MVVVSHEVMVMVAIVEAPVGGMISVTILATEMALATGEIMAFSIKEGTVVIFGKTNGVTKDMTMGMIIVTIMVMMDMIHIQTMGHLTTFQLDREGATTGLAGQGVTPDVGVDLLG